MSIKRMKGFCYNRYYNEIIIRLYYDDGSVVGEFKIVDTNMGFQLQACHSSWKVLKECCELIEFLGSNSMVGVTMEMLADEIEKLGYNRMG